MGLSSNSLIHFTGSKEALIGILKEEFRIKYCLEKVITPEGTLSYAIPMVSFCDIPLSEIKDHISKYGSYGIGFRKQWGQKNGLNPVLYVDQNSTIGSAYYKAFKATLIGKNVKTLSETEESFLDVVRYMKNYEAALKRNKINKSDYRFADEKEWRYVPTKEQARMVVRGDQYTEEIKKMANESISELRLGFDPQDITYIIIKDETEITDFIEVLRRSKGKKYPLDEVERLMTRLITVEQIRTDF